MDQTMHETAAPSLTLRRAVPADAALCARIQRRSWQAAFRGILPEVELDQLTALDRNEAMYRRVLEDSPMEGWLLKLEGEPWAMAFWGPSRDEDTPGWAELVCIHSLPEDWGKGYGGPLLQRVLAQAKAAGYRRIMLWVFEQNARACRFYTKHGFAPAGRRRTYCGAEEVQYTREL